MIKEAVSFWVDAFMWLFPGFMWAGTLVLVMLAWIGLMYLGRKALLGTLELAVIVEAAREAKRQDRAPILKAWTQLGKRWRTRDH